MFPFCCVCSLYEGKLVFCIRRTGSLDFSIKQVKFLSSFNKQMPNSNNSTPNSFPEKLIHPFPEWNPRNTLKRPVCWDASADNHRPRTQSLSSKMLVNCNWYWPINQVLFQIHTSISSRTQLNENFTFHINFAGFCSYQLFLFTLLEFF